MHGSNFIVSCLKVKVVRTLISLEAAIDLLAQLGTLFLSFSSVFESLMALIFFDSCNMPFLRIFREAVGYQYQEEAENETQPSQEAHPVGEMQPIQEGWKKHKL